MGIYFAQEHFGVRVCSKPIPLYDVKINTIDIKVVAMIIIIIYEMMRPNRKYDQTGTWVHNCKSDIALR